MVCYYLSVTHKTQIGGIWNSRGLKISLKSNKWGSEKIGWVVNFQSSGAVDGFHKSFQLYTNEKYNPSFNLIFN